jgi:hypothetical protein
MLGLGSAAMLAGGFSDIVAAEPADMKPVQKPVFIRATAVLLLLPVLTGSR